MSWGSFLMSVILCYLAIVVTFAHTFVFGATHSRGSYTLRMCLVGVCIPEIIRRWYRHNLFACEQVVLHDTIAFLLHRRMCAGNNELLQILRIAMILESQAAIFVSKFSTKI